MIELTRAVRFCVNDDPTAPQPAHNTFAAHPSMRGLGRYYELVVRCRGTVNAATGYFLNIKVIDQAVRKIAVPVIEKACRENPTADPATVLAAFLPVLNAELRGIIATVQWRLTPYYSIEMSPTPTTAPAPVAPPVALLRQQFEFAASHRLHAPALSDAENRSTFGKCNNANGHGHNYRVEPCVEVPVGRIGSTTFALGDLERITAETIVDRFDHKHLNLDTPEFDQSVPTGASPSVENIAKVCFNLLAPAIAAHPSHAKLRSITVWETDKTSCTYPG